MESDIDLTSTTGACRPHAMSTIYVLSETPGFAHLAHEHAGEVPAIPYPNAQPTTLKEGKS